LSNNDWETNLETMVIPKSTIEGAANLEKVISTLLFGGAAASAGEGAASTSGPTSGYNEVIGACGEKHKSDPSTIKKNTKVNQPQAQKLIRKIIDSLEGATSGGGLCSKYVKNIARLYWEAYSDGTKKISSLPSHKALGGTFNPLGGTQDAKSKLTHDNLIRNFGYQRFQVGKNLPKDEVRSLINSFDHNIGDIVAYWDHSSNTGSHQKYGHIQIYKGNNQWHSDFSHSSFVYGKSGGTCWDVIYLKAPDKPIKIK
jgi:hypothetical protein